MHRGKRMIGLDYGAARIGVSYSDANKIIAMPLMTITCEARSELTVAKVVRLLTEHSDANKYDIEEIVIGLPLMMSGKYGLQADEVKHFVQLLKTLVNIPVTLWDERLTTVQAERSMREGGMSRKRRSKVIDKVAAVIILQNYLDHKKISGL